jgi:hypothetical protein
MYWILKIPTALSIPGLYAIQNYLSVLFNCPFVIGRPFDIPAQYFEADRTTSKICFPFLIDAVLQTEAEFGYGDTDSDSVWAELQS